MTGQYTCTAKQSFAIFESPGGFPWLKLVITNNKKKMCSLTRYLYLVLQLSHWRRRLLVFPRTLLASLCPPRPLCRRRRTLPLRPDRRTPSGRRATRENPSESRNPARPAHWAQRTPRSSRWTAVPERRPGRHWQPPPVRRRPRHRCRPARLLLQSAFLFNNNKKSFESASVTTPPFAHTLLF